jgi:hypothetical protein
MYLALSQSGLKLVITQGNIFQVGKVGKNLVITRVRTPCGDLPGTLTPTTTSFVPCPSSYYTECTGAYTELEISLHFGAQL